MLLNAVVYKIIPIRFEYMGIGLILIGIACMASDPQSERVDNSGNTTFAIIFDIVAALPGAIYFMINSRSIKVLPIFTLIWVYNLHIFIL